MPLTPSHLTPPLLSAPALTRLLVSVGLLLLVLVWYALTLYASRHAHTARERQHYRRRAGLLLVLLGLLVACLLHGPALLRLFGQWLAYLNHKP